MNEKPLKIDMSFEEALARLLRVRKPAPAAAEKPKRQKAAKSEDSSAARVYKHGKLARK